MVDFTQTRGVETRESTVTVDPGLKVGSYVFQLTVIDQNGNKSVPARVKVEVVRNIVIADPRLVDPILRVPVVPIIPR